MIDANQSRYAKTRKMSYMDLVEQVEMDPILAEEVCVVPSRHTGTMVINHIDTYCIPEENVVSAGQLPHGIGFDSDHRCIMLILILSQFLGSIWTNTNRGLDAD